MTFLLSLSVHSHLSFFMLELASLETQFRLVQADGPWGADGDRGPAFLPVLITQRQAALWQNQWKRLMD